MPIPDDAQCVTLFKNADAEMFGLTVNDSAAGLPPGAWERVGCFAIGVQEILPVDIPPEPALRALKARGFYTWPMHDRQPYGTSQ
ncbi:MAG TPA: hypothetical protein VM620_11280 [Hyphomicrobium sp.]|jgi:hypothetical protein|nr:hypothetical protein [Hyphomicrobium sp.]